MAFRTIKAALETTLVANAAARFSFEGFQRQSHTASELTGTNRHVSVYYRQGQFEKGRSGMWAGPFHHAMTFAVELVLAAPASMDLRVIDDPNASPQALMSALAASQEAAKVADQQWDELADIVWQILMDARNESLGLTTMVIEDRWISNVQKAEIAKMGEYVLLTGTMDYTCNAVESVTGETALPGSLLAVDSTLTETTDLTGAPLDPAAQGAKVGT
jgi:hypothetical protein